MRMRLQWESVRDRGGSDTTVVHPDFGGGGGGASLYMR